MAAKCEGCGKARAVKRTVRIPLARFALDSKLLVKSAEAHLCPSCNRNQLANFKGIAGERELVEQKGGVDISKVAIQR